jgi:UDP-GlcNAc:undecaprenyl-phosphate GlcNAc-1-phosphate transferase
VAVAGALVLGLVTGWLAWRALAPVLERSLFARPNLRGRTVCTAGGLVLAVAIVAVAAGAAVVAPVSQHAGHAAPAASVLVVVLGLALLGLVDDLAGSGDDGRGFRAHLAALGRGRLTTGGLKLVGGGAVAVVACAPVSGGGAARLVADAALVALAANLGNLFDRAPGRTLKVAAAGFAVLVLASGLGPELAGVAVAVGAGLALLGPDLSERLMLGDTGANALGGVLGLGVVLATGPGARLAVLAGVAALNLAGEVVSFSRVIDAVPVLRAADRAGRPRE